MRQLTVRSQLMSPCESPPMFNNVTLNPFQHANFSWKMIHVFFAIHSSKRSIYWFRRNETEIELEECEKNWVPSDFNDILSLNQGNIKRHKQHVRCFCVKTMKGEFMNGDSFLSEAKLISCWCLVKAKQKQIGCASVNTESLRLMELPHLHPQNSFVVRKSPELTFARK